MTLFDYIVLVILAISMGLGLLRGVVKEILALASWVVAFLFARTFAASFAPHLPFAADSASLRMLSAFAILFVLAFIMMALAGSLVSALLKKVGLAGADRSLGILFGFVRGIAIVLVMVLMAGMTSLPREPSWRNALSSGWFESIALGVKPFLPGELARRIQYGKA